MFPGLECLQRERIVQRIGKADDNGIQNGIKQHFVKVRENLFWPECLCESGHARGIEITGGIDVSERRSANRFGVPLSGPP
jgi:hypothetical protein